MCLVTFVSFALKFHFIPQGTVISAGTANEAFFEPGTRRGKMKTYFFRGSLSLGVHFFNVGSVLLALTSGAQRIKLIKY
jgi:hypothetical protein